MIDLFFYLIIFLFGLIIGSFLNSVIYRLSLSNFSFKDLAMLKNRSYCPQCKHILNWQDLVPVLSFIVLKGKCRYCQKLISWQYPLVELMTAFLFVLMFWQWGLGNYLIFNIGILDFFTLFYFLIITAFLVIIFVYDLKHYIIPDEIIYPAIIITGIFNFQFLIFNQFPIFNSLILSAFGAAGFFLIIVLISHGQWMGGGDIKLAFLMGFFLGWPNILIALFLAFVLGAIIGVGLVIFRKKGLKSKIPFGPFLIGATFIALFFGEKIINWYLNLYFI